MAIQTNERIGLARGSVWREQAAAPAASGVTVGAYGAGAPPRILARDGVPASAWSVFAGSVYQAAWTFADAPEASARPYLWRLTGGTAADALGAPVLLSRKTSTGALAADGDFFVDWAAGNTAATLYVYADVDPGTLPDGAYQAPRRAYALRLGPGATVRGLVMEGQLAPNGALEAGNTGAPGAASLVERCALVDGTKHNLLQTHGAAERVAAWGAGGEAGAGSSTLFVMYADDADGLEALWRDGLAVGGPESGGVVGYYNHSATPGTEHAVSAVEGCYAADCAAAFAGVSPGLKRAARSASGRWCYVEDCETSGALTNAPAGVAAPVEVSHLLVNQTLGGRASAPDDVSGAGPAASESAWVRTDGTPLLRAIAPMTGALTLRRAVLYQEAAAGQRILVARLDGGDLAVDAVGCVFWQHEGQHLNSSGAGSTFVGDYNVYHRRIYDSLEIYWAGEAASQLSTWQGLTGADAHSVYTNDADQTSGNALAFWLGVAEGVNDGPLDGDFRINPAARVYDSAGNARSGTFTDGTPIADVCGLSEPPEAWPAIPATLAEAVEEYVVSEWD